MDVENIVHISGNWFYWKRNWFVGSGYSIMVSEMKPYEHGKISVRKWGGKTTDYQQIHDFLDSSKAHFPDMRHRALLHSSFGIYIAEKVFGINITNSEGREVSVRDIAEQHVIDDMGRIPTVQDYLSEMPFYDWLGGRKKQKRSGSLESFLNITVD